MSMSVEVRARVDASLKDKAELLFRESGLTISEALRLFLGESVRQNRLAVELSQPNQITVQAMKEARAVKHARFASAKDMFDELEKKGPKPKASRATAKG